MVMWFCLDSFVANANPQTAHAGNEKTNLAWLARSTTDSKMRSLVASYFRVNHLYCILAKKQKNTANFYFFTGTCGVG